MGARAHVRETLARLRRQGQLSDSNGPRHRLGSASVEETRCCFQVYNGSRERPYVNPKAPVHVVAGSAVSTTTGHGGAGRRLVSVTRLSFPLQGCRERTDRFNPNPREWSAFRSTDYGYTRMQVLNATHVYLEQVSDDQVSRDEVTTAQRGRPAGVGANKDLSVFSSTAR